MLVSITEVYYHKPLPKERYIRLLRIVQGHTDPFSVTLKAFSLDDLPEYEALSYTWGNATYKDPEYDDDDPEMSSQILIDNLPFHITENLNDGLHQLRNDVKGYLWIDALCIDQTSPTERASQVLLMGDIYSSAKGVIVWLGPPIPELEDVLWLIERYLPTLNDPRFDATSPSLLDDLLGFFQISPDVWFQRWEAHQDFYASYRWFSRAWIVQEFLLARQITILCGAQTLDWTALSLLSQKAYIQGPGAGTNATQFMILSSTRSKFPFADGQPPENMIDFMSAALECRTPEERWCALIIFLLLTVWPQNSTCAHDKVYSIFGMAQKAQPRSVTQAPILKADYKQTPEEAFPSFTTLLMTKLPTLAMLSYDIKYHDNEATATASPSWCPDYAIQSKHLPLLTLNQGVTSGLKPFTACGNLTRESSPCHIEGRTLVVSGKRVALVEKACRPLGPVFSAGYPAFYTPDGVQQLLEFCLLLDTTYNLTSQDRLEVLWRTILLDRGYLFGQAWKYPDANEMYAAFFAFLDLQASTILGYMQGEERERYLDMLRSRESMFGASYPGFPQLETIIDHAAKCSSGQIDLLNPLGLSADVFVLRAQLSGSNRRLFLTSEKWLGSGPELLESGDEVWLMKNAAVPFILRPTGDEQYKLVGEAYVHGIMYGELVDVPGGREGFRDIAIV